MEFVKVIISRIMLTKSALQCKRMDCSHLQLCGSELIGFTYTYKIGNESFGTCKCPHVTEKHGQCGYHVRFTISSFFLVLIYVNYTLEGHTASFFNRRHLSDSVYCIICILGRTSVHF